MVFSEVNYSDIRYHTCYLDTDQDTDKEEDKVKDHTHFFSYSCTLCSSLAHVSPTASLYRPSSKPGRQLGHGPRSLLCNIRFHICIGMQKFLK